MIFQNVVKFGSVMVLALGLLACTDQTSPAETGSKDGAVTRPAAYTPSPITQADKDVAKARLESFVEGTGDPLNTPVSWYTPVRAVSGGGGTVLPLAKTALSPDMVAALEKVEDYFETHKSLGYAVALDGEIIAEKYWGEFTRESRFNPQSMSKTIAALLVGIAIDDGYIKGVDDRIDVYLPELKGDPRGAVTVKNLLQMSSGLEQISTSYKITPENRAVRQHFGPDFIAPMMELKLIDAPGTKWDYNNNETLLLTYVLQRATGQEYASYMSEKIWAPLGLAKADMYLDRTGGYVMTSCCILSRPIDWVTIGQLILDHGVYKGQRLVSAGWIDDMTTPSMTSKSYGYQIWLGDRTISDVRPETPDPNFVWSDTPYKSDGVIVLSGYGFQRVWIIPEKKLVVMRAGNVWPQGWNENYVPNTLIAAVD